MIWLVENFTRPKDLVLDPFCGSGTTLWACRELGRRAIGIEIDERWCREAAERLAQGVLFAPEAREVGLIGRDTGRNRGRSHE